MLLVDTSIWIELLAGRIHGIGTEQLAAFCTCGPVVQEVLQGLRPGPQSDELRRTILSLPCLCDPAPLSVYMHAAAIAIEADAAIWHRDRDYRNIGKITLLIKFPNSHFPG